MVYYDWKKCESFDNDQGASTLKINVKKKRFIANERDLEKNKKKREIYEAELEKIPLENRVYIDEAGTNLGMSRRYARSPEGERAPSKRPGSRGGNISLVGAIRLGEDPALYPFDGAVDADRFICFLDILKPTLINGDVIIRPFQF